MRLKSPTAKPAHRPEQRINSLCISCGDQIHGNYCANCGEKRFDLHDLEIKHLAEESFEGFTHFDNKFFRSAKLLVTKPGLLSTYFCDGKRVPYMRPFALFFVCNLLFFFVVGQSNIFSLPLDSFYHYKPYTNFHLKEIIEKLAPNEQAYAIIATRFNEKMGVQSKTFLFFFIPFLAIGGLAIKRKMYLSAHLVFSTHFLAFIILYYTVASQLISRVYYYLTQQVYNSTFDLTYSLLSLLVFMVYYALAAKRFYSVSTAKAIIGAVLTPFLFLIILYAYRFMLFYKIINEVSI